MIKYKVIAILGKSGSGKDTLLKKLTSIFNVNVIVPVTTRPPRAGEVDGKDYHFMTDEEVTPAILNGELLGSKNFNGWWYGFPQCSLSREKINIVVLNPSAYLDFANADDIELFTICCKIEDKERLLRALRREENPDCYEICRRFIADTNDFLNFNTENFYSYTDDTYFNKLLSDLTPFVQKS